jgi:oligopeptidase A
MPCYQPVMQYADHHGLREKMHHAFVTRASEFGKPEWNNDAIMRRMLELRAEMAQLLGYRNFAEVSLATKMAEKPAEALAFLEDLARRSKPFAERDMDEVRRFAREEMNLADVRASDVAYVSEKLRQKRYAYSDQEVKQYFPEDEVLAGMFRVVETLYGLKIRAAKAETWHASARFHEIFDAAGAKIGEFYLDLYAREGKRGGAWMADAVSRRRLGQPRADAGRVPRLQLSPPGGRQARDLHAPRGADPVPRVRPWSSPAPHPGGRARRLGHQRRRMGRGRAAQPVHGEFRLAVGGGRADDAPCGHGQRIPRALFDKLLAAKNFQGGLGFVRQLEFALFDMRLHSDFNPASGDILALLADVRSRGCVVPFPRTTAFPHQFAHIFAGDTRPATTATSGPRCSRRCLRRVRGRRRPQSGGRRSLPPRGAGRGRQPAGARVLRRVPRAQAADRRPSAP